MTHSFFFPSQTHTRGKKDVTRSQARVHIHWALHRQLVPKGAVSGSPLWDGAATHFPLYGARWKEGHQEGRLKGRKWGQEMERGRQVTGQKRVAGELYEKKKFLQSESNVSPQGWWGWGWVTIWKDTVSPGAVRGHEEQQEREKGK